MIRKSAWLVSAGLFVLTTPAFAKEAQPNGTPPNGGNSQTGTAGQQTAGQPPVNAGDIVITATRRNQALSNVPMAVSAVTSESLHNSGATDIRQLTQLSPSLLVSSTSSEGGAAVARIRGVGTVGDNPGLESSVGVFIDGVYRSRTSTALTELGPIDRIEVLRGPQGTLFGRNTSAGLISIITAKPRFTPEIDGQLDFGNYDYFRMQESVNEPLSDTLAARLDGVYMKRDGFLKDVVSGRRVNDRNRWLLRGQLLYQPNDALSFRLIGDMSRQNEECCAATFLPAHDAVTNGSGGFTYAPSTIATVERLMGGIINDDTFSRNISITPGRDYRSDVKDGGVSGELVYNLGGAELTSITAYRWNEYVRGQDADFNNLDILFRSGDGSNYNRFKTFSQEVRLQGKSGRLDWLVGGYYANEQLHTRDNLAYGTDYLKFANCLIGITPATGLSSFVNPTSPTCFNETAIAGAQAQLNAGITALQGGIAGLQAAIANPATPPAQIPVLQAQLAALTQQLGGLVTQAQGLGAINANPANPGYGSIANALGLAGNNPFLGVAENDFMKQTSNNFAIFTHDIFSITDQLNLTVGARFTHERKTLTANLMDNNVFCSAISGSPLAALQQLPCVIPSVSGHNWSGSSSRTENKLSGTVVLSYKPTPELLTYASYSHGYKAGGFNLDRASLPRSGSTGAVLSNASLDSLQFEPETNNAIEFGAKYHSRVIDVNVAAFQELFDNFQLNLFNGISFEVANVNGCSADLGGADTDNSGATGACTGSLKHGVRSRGVELELFARPMRDLSINLGATIANTRYSNNLVAAEGAPTSAQLFQLPGRQISNASQFTGTGSITWTPPLGNSGLKGLIYVDGRHMSSYNTGSDLDLEKIQPAYTVVNGRIGIHGPDDSWGVELWVQNMFNKNYLQVAFDAPLQGSGATRGVEAGFYPVSTQLYGAFLAEPRTFGLTLRGKIGFDRPAPPVYAPPPAPPPPPMQTCADGSVIPAASACPVPPPPPLPPPPSPAAPERG